MSATLFIALSSSAVWSCQIFYPMLSKTLADRLIASDTIVLVRPNKDSLTHYHVTQVLKGDLANHQIEQFVPVAIRNSILSIPEKQLLLGKNKQGKNWTLLGITENGAFETEVRNIIGHSHWVANERDNKQRIAHFSTLIGHEDSRLFELAYLEVARAPYDLIMEVSPQIELSIMRELISNYKLIAWHPLAILVLGTSDQAIDRNWLVSELQRSHQFKLSQNLAAIATAWIEMNSEGGFDDIVRLYASDQTRSDAELEEIMLALSVHANSTPSLQAKVVALYEQWLVHRPKLVIPITKDLVAWQRWHLTELYQTFSAKENIDLQTKMALRTYLKYAQKMP